MEPWRVAVHGPRVARAEVLLRARGIEHGPMPWFRGERPRIIARGEVVLGSRFQVDGLCERVEFGAMEGAVLRIGDDVRLNRGATVVAFERIELGDHVRVGSDVSILDSAIHEVEEGVAPAHAPVIIEENVWLARGVIVLPGVEIGRHSVIGAGAVVTASIPARSLAVGNPARVVRQVHASDHWVRA